MGGRRDKPIRGNGGTCLRRPKKLLRKVSLDSSNLFDLGNQRELGCGKLGKAGTLGAEHRVVENQINKFRFHTLSAVSCVENLCISLSTIFSPTHHFPMLNLCSKEVQGKPTQHFHEPATISPKQPEVRFSASASGKSAPSNKSTSPTIITILIIYYSFYL